MTCVVPGCNASDQEYLVEFPQSAKLADRWQASIELGTGQKLQPRAAAAQEEQDAESRRRLCLAHFAGDDTTSMISYQEPCCFRNWNGEPVQVSSCRLCLRIGLRAEMFPKSGKLEHVTLSNTIRAVMKVSLAPDDFLSNICERCLVKVDVLKNWARETLQQEMDFRELMNLARKETQLEADIKVETLMVEAKVEVLEEELPEVVEPREKESEPEVADDRGGSSSSSSTSPSSSSSSSDEDDKPLARLRRKRGRPAGRPARELKKRGRKPKPRTEEFGEKVKKKRGRKPGSPKPVRHDYLRNILDKKCYICELIVENNDELVAHLTEVHAGKIDYRCNECNKSFGKVTIYNRHLSCHDITVRPRKCQFCTLCFSAKESLKVHENKVHGADHVLPKKYKRKNKVYQCESCGKIFLTDSLLKQHDLYQHKKMPAATCKICGKTFATKANLEKHYIVHTKERPYKCDKCENTYKTSTALTKHTLMHERVLPYECRYCEERFLTQALYDKHRFLNHKNQQPKFRPQNAITRSIPCALCSDVFSRSTDLQKHINDAHSDRQYPYISCPQCPQQFLQEQTLTAHMNIHTDLFACEICHKPHSSAAQLRDHMESHNPSQPWQCTICLKRFSLQSNFSRHRLIHQDDKRFKCDLCDKGFSQKGQLMNHRRTHTGERPFTCPICGKAFGDQPTFYKHRKRCMEKEGIGEDRAEGMAVNHGEEGGAVGGGGSVGVGGDGCEY
uniref:Zinc finger protein 235 n=2 Tax=Culex pipiens TaxID=7175 RepID=A0A8D8J0Q1_CULPI